MYYIVCGNYRKFKNPKIPYIFEKSLVFSINCSKCQKIYEKIFKEEESVETLKTPGLIKNIQLLLKLAEEKISQEFRLKNVEEARNYFAEEIKQN